MLLYQHKYVNRPNFDERRRLSEMIYWLDKHGTEYVASLEAWLGCCYPRPDRLHPMAFGYLPKWEKVLAAALNPNQPIQRGWVSGEYNCRKICVKTAKPQPTACPTAAGLHHEVKHAIGRNAALRLAN